LNSQGTSERKFLAHSACKTEISFLPEAGAAVKRLQHQNRSRRTGQRRLAFTFNIDAIETSRGDVCQKSLSLVLLLLIAIQNFSATARRVSVIARWQRINKMQEAAGVRARPEKLAKDRARG
jgi:hypothetical protein